LPVQPKGDALHQSAAFWSRVFAGARWLRCLLTLAVLASGFVLWADDADARITDRLRLAAAGGPLGPSSQAPAQSREQEILPCAAQPAYPVGSLDGLFSRPGLVGGFAAGFLGAGVFGLIFGHGIVGELSGLPSLLGLLLQLALLVIFGRLLWTWWRADRAVAAGTLSPRQLADAYGRSRNEGVPDTGMGGSDPAAKNANQAQLPL
jgi:predicted lipid-binding transport protein (Tim44 family)